MSTETKPAFQVGPKRPEEWGDLFLDCSMRILANQSGEDDEAVSYSMNRARLFVERSMAMQNKDA